MTTCASTLATGGTAECRSSTALGGFLHQIGAPGTGSGEMTNPTGVTIGPEGDLWVMDRGNSRIQRFKQDGTFVQLWTKAGSGAFLSPTNIAFDKDGNWWYQSLQGIGCGNSAPMECCYTSLRQAHSAARTGYCLTVPVRYM